MQTSKVTKQTKLKLWSCNNDREVIEENFLIIKDITDNLPTTMVSRGNCSHLNKLELADPTYWKPDKVDALLGAKVYAQILRDGIVTSSNNSPTAIKTMFGWILLGAVQNTCNKETKVFTTITTSLDEQIKSFWEIEEIETKPVLTRDEQQCQEIFQATCERLSSGKYQVKLPFKNNIPPLLGESRQQARRRFQSLQNQFIKRPLFKEEYEKCLDEYIQLKHMEKTAPPKKGEQYYYIPHHAVFKESTTTKLRVVFDASARTSNGDSLNQHLLKGPTLQPTLFITLLNWRKFKIAMNADIQKMYRMIQVHPDHRTYQRIIWRDPITHALQDYKLNTVTFGTTSAPYLAIRIIQQLAEDEREKWPLAAEALNNHFYVDDLLSGADDLKTAKDLQQQLIRTLNSAGFTLRKWTSNNPKLLEGLPKDFIEIKSSLSFAENESVKTLGIRWFPKNDYFTFSIKPFAEPSSYTKRGILSHIASLYDPLGWIAPIIITAKLLMQHLWILGSTWDNPVSEIIGNQWKTFIKDLQHLEQLKIPRWIQYSADAHMQLHGFCDASSKAYAAVLYLRVVQSNGAIHSHLLTSKTKVAPLKPITIPRLELNAAVLLSRLIKNVTQGMKLENIPTIAWTDSTITLHWIQEHPSKWKTYVANRVVEIQEVLRSENWRHISSKANPADLASRGIPAIQLLNNNLWWHGPSWLKEPDSNWPVIHANNGSTDLERKKPKVHNFLTTLDNNILLRYSSFTQLVRIVTTIQRFIYNCKHPKAKQVNFLTTAEYKQQQITIFKLVQLTAFPEEYKRLLQQQSLPTNSQLLKLKPLLDENGLIRVGGRLEHAFLPYDRKHPIILPKNHHVTLILIDKIHLDTMHGGTSLVLNTSRNSFWILDGRRCITSRLHRCIKCFRQRQATTKQLMGNLPAARVNISKPFSKVRIDYAGPITIKTSTLRNSKLQKGYFCIFICMTTKAIHIELVSSLTSEAFVAALKRFVARRGVCTDLYSDCGTNFVGGKSILDKDMHQAIKSSWPNAIQFCTVTAITWHMNPPAAPHFGGLWEAGVKSIKYHLRRTIGNSILTFEEYATVLAQIEACLNSRPLYQLRNEANENFILTPGHFLIGQPLNAIPEPNYDKEGITITQRWKHLQQIIQQFWKVWSRDYLNQLQHRPKWYSRQSNIQEGDIVLLRNENTPPTVWPLGIIEKTFPGTDDLVRVVQVRTQTNTFPRPISKICRLPLDTTKE